MGTGCHHREFGNLALIGANCLEILVRNSRKNFMRYISLKVLADFEDGSQLGFRRLVL
jgi:hypothetical protein